MENLRGQALPQEDATFGAHRAKGRDGWTFKVWAPHATAVCVVGDFNGWSPERNPLQRNGDNWEGFVEKLRQFDVYKFAIRGCDGILRLKTDPYAFHTETRPGTAGKLYELAPYPWRDEAFRRSRRPIDAAPMNIYEMHLGSWKTRENGDFIGYRDLGDELARYLPDMGYTHVELMPVTEHPLDGSWGYQCTGYFAPTSRYGTPDDFKYFVEKLHLAGVGVLLDWVPAHFCKDEAGLFEFDGGCCYEYSDPKKQEHSGWGTRIFDYGKAEVVRFLLSSAAFWLREYHIDGLRVDAVASMLYLDYGREKGEWTANKNGGRENLEAIAFLQALNRMAFAVDPQVLMIAEESTAWPLVTRPPDVGGLGFNLKWNMGWMNDMCHYLKLDPLARQYHHRDITFSMVYAFSENFLLPISHDEVVHLKGSLLEKLPGTEAEKRAGLRGFIAYLLAHPGKKLLFMGAEFGAKTEWNEAKSLDWGLLNLPEHAQIHEFFRQINHFYLAEPALWEIDFDWAGFEWLVADDKCNNVVAFLRRDRSGGELLCVINFSGIPLEGYRLGVPPRGDYREVFNTDDSAFGGSGCKNDGPVAVQAISSHGRETSIAIRIPPLGGVFLRAEGVFLHKRHKGKDESR